MPFDEIAGDREAEPEAAVPPRRRGVALLEGREDIREDLGRNSLARVAHGENRPVSGAAKDDLDPPPGWRELDRVRDSEEKLPADLNQALASTLTVARNELKYVADVETDFGDLPPVPCHLGDLNQVFLNLLVNAAHAIGDVVGTTGRKGQIGVRTAQEGGTVLIAISDTGGGIPEGIRDKIFEPFFTTKEVGRGTGQGLALARAIVVEKHGGTLTFESTLGHGTTFFIRLPVGDVVARNAAA
ncbi:MAG: ATP-binding protein [Candidatus Binatia bacterium]